jgi:hypothetical protein
MMRSDYESNDEEHHGLRVSEPECRVERGGILELKGILETLAVQSFSAAWNALSFVGLSVRLVLQK